MENDNKKPFKIKDVLRNLKKAIVAGSLEEIRSKVAEKFDKSDEMPTIHLDSDGTEIDDEEYFRTLDANTELIAVFPGEHWIDPTHYVTISSRRDTTDASDDAAAAAETARIKELVGKLQNNLCNVSVMSDPDLDSLSNMDPNSLVDITGKEFMDQLKDSGRPLCAKRNAQDRINLLKLLKDGAIFCSERYPEEAEAIDMEISQQLNMETNNTIIMDKTITLNNVAITTTTATTTTTITAASAAAAVAAATTESANANYNNRNPQILINNQTIEQVQIALSGDAIITNGTTANVGDGMATNSANNKSYDI